jgi:hypothetical protein
MTEHSPSRRTATVRWENGWSHPVQFGHDGGMTSFVPALELNAAFYVEVVRPLVQSYDHAASLLGWGSDVLGYDTERSTDHGWGLRLQVFVAESDVAAVRAVVDGGLPESFRGWPVRFGWEDPEHEGPIDVRHFVDVTTLGGWLSGQLGVDSRPGLDVVDWLVMPQQHLLGVVRGAVYADPCGELANVRRDLAYYPDDVWRWMLACQWRRLAQEEHLIGRAAQVGDELGSRVAGVRQVREIMRLAFLLDKAYWPYTKWFGTAFAELSLASTLAPMLDAAVAAEKYPAREEALCAAYELLADRHNELGVTSSIESRTRQFFDRPFRVLAADRFAFATRDTVVDPMLRGFPMLGSVDQFADSTDVLSGAGEARKLRAMYA